MTMIDLSEARELLPAPVALTDSQPEHIALFHPPPGIRRRNARSIAQPPGIDPQHIESSEDRLYEHHVIFHRNTMTTVDQSINQSSVFSIFFIIARAEQASERVKRPRLAAPLKSCTVLAARTFCAFSSPFPRLATYTRCSFF